MMILWNVGTAVFITVLGAEFSLIVKLFHTYFKLRTLARVNDGL